ncbi:MAG: 6-phosphogluconolactonase [Sulfuriferula sp.]
MSKENCLAKTRWLVVADVVTAALVGVAQAADRAISIRGEFHIVLAGGNTPKTLYERMVNLDTDWSRWHIWYGDERCLPADDVNRNSHMATQAWLAHCAIPAAHIHPIPAELGAGAAAAIYCEQLQQIDMFDLVLLGLGEDGHTASLFPNQFNPDETAAAIAVHHAPKPPADRVSLSVRCLNDSRAVLFLVTGAGKRDAVAAWQRGDAIPAAAICIKTGVDVLLEPACVERKS